MKVSERLHALEESAKSDHSAVSWPAQVALGKLASDYLRRAVEALELEGHGSHDHACAPCSMLGELSADLDGE